MKARRKRAIKRATDQLNLHEYLKKKYAAETGFTKIVKIDGKYWCVVDLSELRAQQV